MLKKMGCIFNSLSTKVIIAIIVLVFPLNLIAIEQNRTVTAIMIEQARMTIQNVSDTYMAELGTRMLNMQSLLYYFYTQSPEFYSMKLQEEKTYEYQNAKQIFYTNLKKLAGMTDGGDGYFYHMKVIDDTLIYDENPSKSGLIYQEIDALIKTINADGIQNGWAIYELNSSKYLFFIAGLNDVIYGGWLNISDISADLASKLEYSQCEVYFSEKKEDLNSKEQIHVSVEKKGIYLNYLIPRTEIIRELSIYQRVLQAMVFLFLILIPLLLILLRRMFIKPLQIIIHAHRQIQNGDQDFRINKKGNSAEYQETFQSFNSMADNLKNLKIAGYEKEIARQKMELKNLQLQIRSHFLLNTFNLVYTLAQRKEYTAIQDTIMYLSNYFRHIFRNEKEMEIFTKELNLIKDYIKMINVRYPNNVHLEYEIDPEIYFLRTPPLLIHNLIENSVMHGMKAKQELMITLIARYEEQKVCIWVIDDGKGMDKEQLDYCNQLFTGEVENKNTNSHIGLQNTIRRLRYFFGEETTMKIESEPDGITSVKIVFPYNLEVDDEFTDNQ